MPEIKTGITPETWPKTVEEAAVITYECLNAGELHILKNIEKIDLFNLRLKKFHFAVGEEMKMKFGLHGWNEALIEDCERNCGMPVVTADNAVNVIIERVWEMVNQPRQEG